MTRIKSQESAALLLAALLAFIACQAQRSSAAIDSDTSSPIADLSTLRHDELLEAFVDEGRRLVETVWIPRLSNSPLSAHVSVHPVVPEPLDRVEREIIRRGNDMVDPLLDFLASEIHIVRPEHLHGERLDFTRRAVMLLAEIGDVRCAPRLIDVFESVTKDNPNAVVNVTWSSRTEGIQHVVLHGLHRLMHVRFSGYAEPYWFHNHYSIPATGKWFLGRSANVVDLADLYQKWFDTYGFDRDRWTQQAIVFAREHLASGDPARVRIAITFLQASVESPTDPICPWRDDDPVATLEELARFVSMLETLPEDHGRRVVEDNQRRAWLSALCHYGPIARPHSELIINLVREYGLHDWSGYMDIRRVGGDAIIEFALECMPVIHERAEAIRLDPSSPTHFPGGDERLAWLSSDSYASSIFDRWAGRDFKSIDERLKWWNENRELSEEDRFRMSLHTVIDQIESGNRRSRWILASLVPGCIVAGSLDSADIKCIRENLDQLEYDAEIGAFRVPNPVKVPAERRLY